MKIEDKYFYKWGLLFIAISFIFLIISFLVSNSFVCLLQFCVMFAGGMNLIEMGRGDNHIL